MTTRLATILSASPPAPSSANLELSIWKWVIIIGIAAVVVFYIIKRVSEIVVDRKTDAMIRKVVGENGNDDTDSKD